MTFIWKFIKNKGKYKVQAWIIELNFNFRKNHLSADNWRENHDYPHRPNSISPTLPQPEADFVCQVNMNPFSVSGQPCKESEIHHLFLSFLSQYSLAVPHVGPQGFSVEDLW